MTSFNKYVLSKEDQENKEFLERHLNKNISYYWSNISPYETEINGEIQKFENSYEAHLAKHPNNKKEREFWENMLWMYPNNNKEQYIKLARIIIKASIIFFNRSNYSFISGLARYDVKEITRRYDKKNHSLNIDLKTKDNKVYRTSIKRAYKNQDKVVITTLHPRIKTKSYNTTQNNIHEKTLTNYCMKILNNSNKHPILKERILHNKNVSKNLEMQIADSYLKQYMIDAYMKLNRIEYVKSQKKYFELTDEYDYNEIIQHIDNLILCIEAYQGKSLEDQVIRTTCHSILNKYKKVDQFKQLNRYMYQIGIKTIDDRISIDYNSGTRLQLAKKLLCDLCDQYGQDLGEKYYNIVGGYGDKSQLRRAKNFKSSAFMPPHMTFILAKCNEMPFYAMIALLELNNQTLPYDFLKAKGYDIEGTWNEKYDKETMDDIIDIIDNKNL